MEFVEGGSFKGVQYRRTRHDDGKLLKTRKLEKYIGIVLPLILPIYGQRTERLALPQLMKNFGVQRAVTGPCACNEVRTVGQSSKTKVEESVAIFTL
jgi:hypothetical protein